MLGVPSQPGVDLLASNQMSRSKDIPYRLKRRKGFARTLMFFLLIPLLLVSACGEPRETTDCDGMLGRKEFQLVLEQCDQPFYRASAYIGLAGLDLLEVLATGVQPGNVIELLGLTTDNIAERAEYLYLGVEEVRTPRGGNEAFALLIGSFLGTGVVTRQFLDPNLDGNISDEEANAASGMSLAGSLDTGFVFPLLSPQFQVVVGDKSYIVLCTDLTALPLCDNNPEGSILVWDDADGSGRLPSGAAPSADTLTVIAGLAGATAANQIGALSNLVLPVKIDETKSANVSAFLGEGDPETDIPIGITGYLGLMGDAIAAMEKYAGGGSGGDEIQKHLDAVRNLIDNGAKCFDEKIAGAAAPMNMLYALYKSAVGTKAQPVPDPAIFTSNNIIPPTELEAAGIPIYTDADTVFTVPVGYKVHYPLAPPLGAYDVAQVTPRVDKTTPEFAAEFENVARLAPAASSAGDGKVSYGELLCVGQSGATPPP